MEELPGDRSPRSVALYVRIDPAAFHVLTDHADQLFVVSKAAMASSITAMVRAAAASGSGASGPNCVKTVSLKSDRECWGNC